MNSRVHPKYKTKYRVGNWREYERALVRRGDVTFWLSADAIDAWKPAPSGRRGAQRKFSDRAIETALTLRLVFRLPLRQAEGFLRSVLSMMRVDLDAPDHTTLSRRSRDLSVEFHRIPVNEPIHLVVDSTGLSIVGEGEWAAVKHGGRGRRGWRKLHLGVDGSGAIVAYTLTDGNADDAATVLALIETVDGKISCVTLRHGRDLRGGRCAWRHGRHSPDDNAGCVAAETTVELSRLHDPEGEAGGERLLPVQVDHW